MILFVVVLTLCPDRMIHISLRELQDCLCVSVYGLWAVVIFCNPVQPHSVSQRKFALFTVWVSQTGVNPSLSQFSFRITVLVSLWDDGESVKIQSVIQSGLKRDHTSRASFSEEQLISRTRVHTLYWLKLWDVAVNFPERISSRAGEDSHIDLNRIRCKAKFPFLINIISTHVV